MRRSPLGIIFLTIFLDLVGFGIVLPLLPRFAAMHLAAEWQIGLLMASYSSMQFFFAPVWGRLSDRIGRRPVLLFSTAGSAISYLIFAFAPNLPALFAARIVAGIMAANVATAQAYVADVTTAANRAKGMGLIGVAFGLGFVLGPALAGLLSHWSVEASYPPQLVVGLAAAALSLADFALAAARLPESLTPEIRARAAAAPAVARPARMAAALRHPRLGVPVLIFFLSTMAWSQLEPTLARLGQIRFQFDEAQTGFLFAYLGLIVAVVQGGCAGRMARTTGEGRMVLTGTIVLAAGLILLPLMHAVPALLAALALLGLGQALAMPGLQSLISRSAGAEEQGATLGVTQGFSSLARALGPAAGGWLFGKGYAYPFWFGALLVVAAIILAGRFARIKPAPA